MQKERDDIDKAIFDAFNSIEPDSYYNEKLIERLHSCSLKQRDKTRPIAVSLILSGILAITLYTSNFQFRIIDFKYKVTSHIMAFQYTYRSDLQKIILGE